MHPTHPTLATTGGSPSRDYNIHAYEDRATATPNEGQYELVNGPGYDLPEQRGMEPNQNMLNMTGTDQLSVFAPSRMCVSNNVFHPKTQPPTPRDIPSAPSRALGV